MITLDFETMPIKGNPLLHPPVPIGLAIKVEYEESLYITGIDDMRRVFGRAVAGGHDLIFHNAPFDLSVARTHLGIPWPRWDRIHDTGLSAYLVDPHSRSLALKPLAQRHCNMAPEGRDELREWILDNVPKSRESSWGRWIYKAQEDPYGAKLVAKYACADTDMTYALHNALLGRYRQEPYDVDRELAPYLIESTIKGIRIDRERLAADTLLVEQAIKECERRLRELLNQPASFNVNSPKQLADALDAIGAVSEWRKTAKGARSVSRDNLAECVTDPEILNHLVYRGAMSTCHGTFMKGWLKRSEADGRLHPNWNQFKVTHGKSAKGTRTGRLSSDDPNFQNVPNSFDVIVPDGLMLLPHMRDYLLPEVGHTWISRDFDGQEMRTLAHFEEGTLFEAFRAEPGMDPHALVQELIYQLTGVKYTRGQCKATGFGIIYGMGARGLAIRLDISEDEARELINVYLTVLPGVAELQRDTKIRGAERLPLRTWGGREYMCEEPTYVKSDETGEMELRSFEYKLLNYLNQGSAADQTKRCLLDWFKTKREHDVFMATVHDEINISAPTASYLDSDEQLRQAMEQELFDVPMLTSPSYGQSWGTIQ